MTDHFMAIHDFVEENGKTIRENNLGREHKIHIGTLVEIKPVEESDDYNKVWAGIRLFVVQHTRDCDGTPLYSLGPNQEMMPELYGRREEPFHYGFSEEGLDVVVK